jgi:hypothetical protein
MEAPANGFTAIVNCAPTGCLTNRDYYVDNVNYIECDISFDGTLPARVDTFITRQLSFGRKVLIHCTSGINLSAVVAVAYYMVSQNVDVVTAVKHCFACRPIILTSDCFVRRLIEFEQQQIVCALQQKAADLEEELISAKRLCGDHTRGLQCHEGQDDDGHDGNWADIGREVKEVPEDLCEV